MNQRLPDIRAITYRQCADTEVRTLLLPASILLHIEAGSKQISTLDNKTQCASSGDFVFLQSHTEFTIRNNTGPLGDYVAQGLVFHGNGLSDQLAHSQNKSEAFRCFKPPTEMVEAFARMRMATQHSELPDEVVFARFTELKAWLSRLAIRLSYSARLTLVHRLREMLAGDLAHPWRGTEVAVKLGMSEASLRRNLAREGTSFSKVLREARLQSALERLQTSEQSLAEIAYNTGFSSHSHFTDVFRKHFEFPPSHLRGRGEPQLNEI
ncbi:AraC family transcriptional regulator [uncultured Shimia sp.]|uniref:helix-turn-helix transcriptional regulator n=1 Tax=uncultured Shimia sp. TaxID=573152 RepID=UPI0025EDA6C1|nr:AraC family transcriptional regulator [uncultured Shimia sp.]